MSFEDLDVRKIYETNQLYQSDDPILINLAEKINEAEKYAFENCVIKDIPDYSVFADIEKRAIELEQKKYKETKKIVKGITKSIIETSDKKNENEEDKNLLLKSLKEVTNKYGSLNNLLNEKNSTEEERRAKDKIRYEKEREAFKNEDINIYKESNEEEQSNSDFSDY